MFDVERLGERLFETHGSAFEREVDVQPRHLAQRAKVAAKIASSQGTMRRRLIVRKETSPCGPQLTLAEAEVLLS